ncbi:ABC transporter ATP-binding protein [Ruegeria sp. HKCCD4332]|uniref:ABC transporter ATP-binding protein n=1 Tax=Ruegeria sp. HKCCD4332 TaxID=2683021 RepID=UPI001480E4D6|nr:oligopeptide/dipeptide ABC transporter ATP-binding protein [Ruegeria sp. HKCCD4332]NOD78365.1 ATP-binding cassette domain-containing protein [Ruegeria sp. HKCCD4332]
MTVALKLENLAKTYAVGRNLIGKPKGYVHAVRPFSLDVATGDTLGIVGESGCGKSTLARMLVGLLAPTEGHLEVEGETLDGKAPAEFGRMIQYVFQDPISSLNPRKTIRQIIEQPLIHLHSMRRAEREARILEIFGQVNLRPEFLNRRPHEFSGGQAQRIGIARALAANPRILVLDEPVSALDVSVQAQVINLLADLKEKLSLTYVFISHDLAVVEAVCDRVAVMYFGSIVEMGDAREIFTNPRHPYTKLLAESAPVVGTNVRRTEAANAELPDPMNPPKGCAFAARCEMATELCRTTEPNLNITNDSHHVACHHA